MHRWLWRDADPGEGCLACISCGIQIHFPRELEEEAIWMLPECGGPEASTEHHFSIVPHVSLELNHWQIECDCCGAAADEPGFGPGSYDPECRRYP